MAKKRQKRVLFLGIISLVFLYPVIYMLICSVWEGKNAGVSMMGYYRVLLESPGYLVKFWRSLGMCLLIAGGQTILACMAGTAFAKYRFIGKKFWLAMMALFMILPVQVTLLPNYILMEKLGFLNSWKSLIIPGIFSPFGTVWLTFIFQSIPDEWLEAARLDRANQLQIVRYIVVPAAKPAVVTLFVLTFVESWNMVEQPLVYLANNSAAQPLSVMFNQISTEGADVAFAGSALYILPTMLIYLYFQEDILQGVQLSELK